MQLSLRCFPFLVLAAAALSARAQIAFTTGSMVEVGAPISFETGATESSSEILIFDEGITLLSSDVLVNAFGPGSHGGTVPPTLTISMGTLVRSYLVHFDPLGASFATLTGAVFFTPGEFIIGVQTYTPLLYAADPIVGDPLATYPGVFDAFRGFETLPGADSVTLPLDMASASFSLFAELGVDHARIFTVPIPAPSSLALLATFGALCASRRRPTSPA